MKHSTVPTAEQFVSGLLSSTEHGRVFLLKFSNW